MSDLVRWNPYEEMERLRDEFNQTFVPFWAGRSSLAQMNRWGPSVDVKETTSMIEVSAEIPGANSEDINISVSDDSVVISGEIKSEATESGQGFQRLERRYGSFQRVIPLPTTVKHEQATAEYKNGILTLQIPKAEPGKAKSTQIKLGKEPPQLL